MSILHVPVTAPDTPGGRAEWSRRVAATVNQLVAKNLKVRPTVTGTYTLEDDYDIFPLDSTGGAFTVTLASAGASSGRLVYFKRINAGANNITIDGNGSETIDGAATTVLTVQWESRTLYSDGSNWLIL